MKQEIRMKTNEISLSGRQVGRSAGRQVGRSADSHTNWIFVIVKEIKYRKKSVRTKQIVFHILKIFINILRHQNSMKQ